jgi:hypothetical protein
MLVYPLTGDTQVDDHVVVVVARYARPGEHHFGGYRLTVPDTAAGLLATLYRGGEALGTIGVAGTAEDADIVWPALAELISLEDPRRPEWLPWVAIIVGGIPEEAAGLTKFALHLACAWLSRRPRGLVDVLDAKRR